MVITFQTINQTALSEIRTDTRFAPSQGETALLCNDVSRWLGANLESAMWNESTRIGVVISLKYHSVLMTIGFILRCKISDMPLSTPVSQHHIDAYISVLRTQCVHVKIHVSQNVPLKSGFAFEWLAVQQPAYQRPDYKFREHQISK